MSCFFYSCFYCSLVFMIGRIWLYIVGPDTRFFVCYKKFVEKDPLTSNLPRGFIQSYCWTDIMGPILWQPAITLYESIETNYKSNDLGQNSFGIKSIKGSRNKSNKSILRPKMNVCEIYGSSKNKFCINAPYCEIF